MVELFLDGVMLAVRYCARSTCADRHGILVEERTSCAGRTWCVRWVCGREPVAQDVIFQEYCNVVTAPPTAVPDSVSRGSMLRTARDKSVE